MGEKRGLQGRKLGKGSLLLANREGRFGGNRGGWLEKFRKGPVES